MSFKFVVYVRTNKRTNVRIFRRSYNFVHVDEFNYDSGYVCKNENENNNSYNGRSIDHGNQTVNQFQLQSNGKLGTENLFFVVSLVTVFFWRGRRKRDSERKVKFETYHDCQI